MKKRMIISIFLVLIIITNLCGCKLFCNHNWVAATCEKPRYCTKCGKTTGTKLEHKWEDATCTEPPKCTRCKTIQADSSPPGHNYEGRYCTRCNSNIFDSLNNVDFYTMINDEEFNPSHMWLEINGYNINDEYVWIYDDYHRVIVRQFDNDLLTENSLKKDSLGKLTLTPASNNKYYSVGYKSGRAANVVEYWEHLGSCLLTIEDVVCYDGILVVKVNCEYGNFWLSPLSMLDISGGVINKEKSTESRKAYTYKFK